MLFDTFTTMLYSVVMYYVFYKIPLKYNLVAWQRMGVKRVDIEQNIRQSMTTKGLDGNLEQFLEAESHAHEFDKLKSSDHGSLPS